MTGRSPRLLRVSASTTTPTRDALLDAGVSIAERYGLARLSVNLVVEEAGLAKGTFYVHFADREAFVDAIHERFYGRVSARVAEALDGVEPGAERLRRGMIAYLDACLADRAVKALLTEARAGGGMASRQAMFAALAEPSVRAMGMRDARVTARLFMALTSEAALLELEAGRKVPAARRAIESLLAAAARPR